MNLGNMLVGNKWSIYMCVKMQGVLALVYLEKVRD